MCWRSAGGPGFDCAEVDDMSVLTLPLQKLYFDQIQSGEKIEEYRLRTDYWAKRLEGRDYDRIILTLGYPRADDMSRRIERPWRGYVLKQISHPHFGYDLIEVYAIDVSQ
jgi:hypothetical protein